MRRVIRCGSTGLTPCGAALNLYADGHIWINERRRKERLALYKKEKIAVDEDDRIKDFQRLLFNFP